MRRDLVDDFGVPRASAMWASAWSGEANVFKA